MRMSWESAWGRTRSTAGGTIASGLRAAAVSVAISLCALASPAMAGGDWNDAGVAWKGYEDGLAEARSTNKPVCLIFYTDTCPHCINYSGIFHDPGVVALSKNFVMIRVNETENRDLGARYVLDGRYIPRTYFLKSDGTPMPEVAELRATNKYFYNERDPTSISRSMNNVLASLRGSGEPEPRAGER